MTKVGILGVTEQVRQAALEKSNVSQGWQDMARLEGQELTKDLTMGSGKFEKGGGCCDHDKGE